MKTGAILINTSRGALVGEVALYRALTEGKLAAAGLDVFATSADLGGDDKAYSPPNTIASMEGLAGLKASFDMLGTFGDQSISRKVIESLKCLESGVLRSVEDGNIGSIMGIGAPLWAGGFLQFVETYGYSRFVERCHKLAAIYGERFSPPQIALDKAAT